MTEINSLGLRLGFTTNKDIELMIPIFLGWKILLKLVLNIVQYSCQESNVRQNEKNWYFCLPVARRVLRIWHLTVFFFYFSIGQKRFWQSDKNKKEADKTMAQWFILGHKNAMESSHPIYVPTKHIRVRRFSLTLYYNTKWWYYDIIRFSLADSISSHAGTPWLLPIIF